MRTDHFLLVAAGALMLWSCDVKDPLYEPDDSDKGKITITTDWSNIGQGIARPSGYTVVVGDKSFPATADKYILPEPIAPGNYTFYLYNNAEHITVNGTMATADYTAGAPGWFFTGRLDADIGKDRNHEFTITMRQQVCRLTLAIEPKGTTADKIESINGTLTGAAGSLDFGSDSHGAPTDIPLVFTKRTSGDHTGKWTATVHLLGIAGVQQKLTGLITFTDGNLDTVAMDSDLSGGLADFNADKKTPFTLAAQIEVPTDPGFTATITDWNNVTGSGTAH